MFLELEIRSFQTDGRLRVSSEFWLWVRYIFILAGLYLPPELKIASLFKVLYVFVPIRLGAVSIQEVDCHAPLHSVLSYSCIPLGILSLIFPINNALCISPVRF